MAPDAAAIYTAARKTIQDVGRYQTGGRGARRSLGEGVGYVAGMTTGGSHRLAAQNKRRARADEERMCVSTGAGFRYRTCGLSLLVASMIASVPVATAHAQGADKPVRTASGERVLGTGITAPVLLHVRPQTGDVLLMHMQQTVEMGGLRLSSYSLPPGAAQGLPEREPVRTPPRGPRRSALPARVTIMDFYAHSAVELSDAQGAVVATVVDSLLVKSGTAPQMRAQRMAMNGEAKPTRIRVMANGSMAMVDAPGNVASVGASLSAMPAMLPDGPVKVGDVWERDVEVPPLPVASYRADGVLHAIFRLDSISRTGREAYVSMRGTLRREGAPRDLPRGTQVITDGIMSGTLLLDRVRGWITEADTVIDVISDVVGAPEAGQSMQIGIRIRQQLRVR